MNELKKYTVFIRGAGELASSVALTLHRVGFKVFMSELSEPLAIRRTVCFGEAMRTESIIIENIKAVRSDINCYKEILNDGNIPIFTDSVDLFTHLNPDIYIDARMMKVEVSNRRNSEYFTIGLGPGFIVGKNCDSVIETMRGHNLGKVLWNGFAKKNTGVPGEIGGESSKRVIHSECDGKVKWIVNIGDIVDSSQLIGTINNLEIKSKIAGLVRGLISSKVDIKEGMKIADIDPRGEQIDYMTISDKARNIGRGALEAILTHLD